MAALGKERPLVLAVPIPSDDNPLEVTRESAYRLSSGDKLLRLESWPHYHLCALVFPAGKYEGCSYLPYRSVVRMRQKDKCNNLGAWHTIKAQ